METLSALLVLLCGKLSSSRWIPLAKAIDAELLHNEGGRCMEEWQHLSNGVQMQGPVTCSLRPDEMSNQCDGGEILYPKLGCIIQGSNFTKHVFHTLIQRNHGWVLHSISYTVLPMQDILIEFAELCNLVSSRISEELKRMDTKACCVKKWVRSARLYACPDIICTTEFLAYTDSQTLEVHFLTWYIRLHPSRTSADGSHQDEQPHRPVQGFTSRFP